MQITEHAFHGFYGELLLDARWRARRSEILKRDNFRCVLCGASEKLTVHHKQYHINKEGNKYVPWAYDDKYMITLCENCHAEGHSKFKVPTFVVN